jgi:6-pyruvoyltetrahydropterin/6-carboxytetrahydropterin synthase
MFEIRVESHFDAAHFLREYEGKCEALRRAPLQDRREVEPEKLNEIGLAYDFTDLKHHLAGILSRLDHTCLNDVPPFDKINPSSENIARISSIISSSFSVILRLLISKTTRPVQPQSLQIHLTGLKGE